MGFILFNDNITQDTELGSLSTNRGFLYGDGFFETIRLQDHRIYFLDAHLERALHAMNTLQLPTDTLWTEERLKTTIQKLWIANGSPANGIFKWMVWRNSEGLYSPSNTSNSHYLIELKPFRSAPLTKDTVYLAQTVKNNASLFSTFKSLSALHYVLAGIEKNDRKADELILTDQSNHLSEATSSCLFWIVDQSIYTPSLATGCVEGVVRKSIFKWAKKSSIEVNEVLVEASNLPAEATVFTANVGGLSLIRSLESTRFKNDSLLYGRINEALFETTSFSQNLEIKD